MTENSNSYSYFITKPALKAIITKRNKNSYIINNAKTYHFLRCPNEYYKKNSGIEYLTINQPLVSKTNQNYDDFNIELKYDSESIKKYKHINKLRKQEKDMESKLLKMKKRREEHVRTKLLELSMNIEKINLNQNSLKSFNANRKPSVKFLENDPHDFESKIFIPSENFMKRELSFDKEKTKNESLPSILVKKMDDLNNNSNNSNEDDLSDYIMNIKDTITIDHNKNNSNIVRKKKKVSKKILKVLDICLFHN
ncbi:hypothetical protein LY90DRAFT_294894 [Neocallimastix californiae]|uniref:Uncharacterized protein n=1 Tax=Neocallimastix californiae TaxID=1754190 RepID=A0A1Y2CRK8_9FUNG|nr:hypothetical protein LY90DRAFT_294894 [Neocallimastix californiae]|eukprot:ORY49641.1 hypothetical protein LY90DRAFT_294894 [Neocallimastix californiae]